MSSYPLSQTLYQQKIIFHKSFSIIVTYVAYISSQHKLNFSLVSQFTGWPLSILRSHCLVTRTQEWRLDEMSHWRVELTQKYWLIRFSCQWWLLSDQVSLFFWRLVSLIGQSLLLEKMLHSRQYLWHHIFMWIPVRHHLVPTLQHAGGNIELAFWKLFEKQKGKHCHSLSC